MPAALAPAAIRRNKTPERLTSARQTELVANAIKTKIKHKETILLISRPPCQPFFSFLMTEGQPSGPGPAFAFNASGIYRCDTVSPLKIGRNP
jgi:hypothetical protein